MVAVLVGDDVLLGQVAAVGAEPARKLIEERRIDVDPAVQRTIERPDLVGRGATAGLRRAGVDDGRCLGVLLAVLRQQLTPEGLHAVDRGDDEALVVTVGVGSGLALGEVAALLASGAHLTGIQGAALAASGRGVGDLGVAAADRTPAKDHHEDEQDEATDAATDLDATRETPAATAEPTTAAAPAGLHLRGVELDVLVEGHAPLQSRGRHGPPGHHHTLTAGSRSTFLRRSTRRSRPEHARGAVAPLAGRERGPSLAEWVGPAVRRRSRRPPPF